MRQLINKLQVIAKRMDLKYDGRGESVNEALLDLEVLVEQMRNKMENENGK